jgi:glycerophosphoryl diester phosphodiesterase
VLSKYDEPSRMKYEALAPDFLFCDHLALPPAGALRRGPWRWAIYEVDDFQLATQLAARGVDYIETMAVREMSQALRQNAGA